jgi:hypothetical protein
MSSTSRCGGVGIVAHAFLRARMTFSSVRPQPYRTDEASDRHQELG